MHDLGASMPSVNLCENLHIEIKPLQVNCEAHEALCKLVISHMMTASLAKEKKLTIFLRSSHRQHHSKKPTHKVLAISYF
jgi:hypothetical protein